MPNPAPAPVAALSRGAPRSGSGFHAHRLLLAEGNVVLLEMLERFLTSSGYDVVGTAENGRRAVVLVRERHPDVAVLDASMPVMGGLDAAREILRALPATGVLLLTGYAEDGAVLEALRIGVRGIVLTAQGVEDLLRAIHEVGDGGLYLSPCYFAAVVEFLSGKGRAEHSRLTTREVDVLREIVEGKTMKQTAAALKMSVRTAECHRARIMSKLHIRDTAGLVRYAIRRGLIVA